MRLKNYNWTFPGAIPPTMCDQIIEYGLSQIPVKGKHGGQRLTKLRDSDVAWIYDKWVLDICNEYITKLVIDIEPILDSQVGGSMYNKKILIIIIN